MKPVDGNKFKTLNSFVKSDKITSCKPFVLPKSKQARKN